MKLGSFAELFSGQPDAPFVAQIVAIDKAKNRYLCRWLFRATDLPDGAFTADRSRETFSVRELILCDAGCAVKTDDWNPPEALLREVQVIKKLPGESSGDCYFYRQTLNPDMQTLSPTLVADVMGARGEFGVENPDDLIYQCLNCKGKWLQAALGSPPQRSADHHWGTYQPFTCSACSRESWKMAPLPKRDDKRMKVVGKFAAALNVALTEHAGAAPELFNSEQKVEGMAAAIEAALFHGEDYLARARSLIFNLNDPQNPSLRRRVILSELSLGRLISANPAELASEELKSQRKAQQERYYQQQVLLAATAEAETVLPETQPQSKKPRIEEEQVEELSSEQVLASLEIAPPPKPAAPAVTPIRRLEASAPVGRPGSAVLARLLQDCDRLENPIIRDAIKAAITK